MKRFILPVVLLLVLAGCGLFQKDATGTTPVDEGYAAAGKSYQENPFRGTGVYGELIAAVTALVVGSGATITAMKKREAAKKTEERITKLENGHAQ